MEAWRIGHIEGSCNSSSGGSSIIDRLLVGVSGMRPTCLTRSSLPCGRLPQRRAHQPRFCLARIVCVFPQLLLICLDHVRIALFDAFFVLDRHALEELRREQVALAVIALEEKTSGLALPNQTSPILPVMFMLS